jgi:hypothetical protein
MIIFLLVFTILVFSFLTAFIQGLIEQHRQNMRDEKARRETQQWLQNNSLGSNLYSGRLNQ